MTQQLMNKMKQILLITFLFTVCIVGGRDIKIKWYILGPFQCGMNEVIFKNN